MSRRVLALFACLVVSAGVIARADRAENIPPRQTLEHLPLAIGEWTGVHQTPFTKDILAILGVDDYITRAYFTPARAALASTSATTRASGRATRCIRRRTASPARDGSRCPTARSR